MDFASALTAALLANKPREVFKMDENLSFAAFSGLPRLREGDFGGVVDPSATTEGVGFETDTILFSMGSPAFFGDLRTEVDTDLMCPNAVVVRSGRVGSRNGDLCLCSSPRFGILKCGALMVSLP